LIYFSIRIVRVRYFGQGLTWHGICGRIEKWQREEIDEADLTFGLDCSIRASYYRYW